MSVNVPNKMPVPFADAGLKNTIPASSDNVNGLAGYNQGFPPINMTPKTAGGIPPFGEDMNGILFAVTECLRYFQAGSIYAYDSTFSTAVGGYRAGASVLRTDGTGRWLNLTDGNATDPESAGAAAAGWVPDFTYGIASVTMTNANVTLTPAQYGKPIISISGTLTANLNLIFPNIAGIWTIVNSTTGAFTITCKTSAGTGVAIPQGGLPQQIYNNATNIVFLSSIPDATTTVKGKVALATPAEVATGTDNTKAITPLALRTGTIKSFIRLNGANGLGSTNTAIRRFTNVVETFGTDVTYADSATLGASFTIVNDGLYSISYTDGANGTAIGLGITINSAQLTTAYSATTVSTRLCGTDAQVSLTGCASGTFYLTSGSVLRPHVAPGAVGSTSALFTITRIA